MAPPAFSLWDNAADASSFPAHLRPPARGGMLTSVAGWAACVAAGIALQLRVRDPERLNRTLFLFSLWIAAPLVVFFSYTTLPLRAGLLAALPVAIAASWIVVGIGFLWARAVGRERGERGVLAIATAMGNTATVGYPLALVVFGSEGLALAVVYSEFQLLIPTLAVQLGVASRFAGPRSRASAAGPGSLLRSWLLNPPVAAGALAVALRLAGVDLSEAVAPVGPVAGVAVGVLGFFQIGVAVPLEPLAHTRGDLWRAAATTVLRCGAAPLVLYLSGRLLGIHIPAVFLLLAAMPVAFNTIVLARVYDLEARLARLLVAVSTPLVIGGVLIWQAL